MLHNEAKWFADKISGFDVKRLSPLVNLGSSTLSSRQKGHPFISQLIFNPMAQRGIKVIHVDLEEGDGVDITGDLFDKAVYAKILNLGPKAVFCSNILEHVVDPTLFARLCIDMLPSGGIIFVSVPFSFPFHPAPIDTMYRPNLTELCDIFSECTMLFGEIVKCETFARQFRNSISIPAKHFIHLIIPWRTVHHWKSALHKNLWLFKNYQVTCAVFEK